MTARGWKPRIEEVVTRLETDDRPSRELDCLIAGAIGWVMVVDAKQAPICWNDETGLPRDNVPAYTSSLDDARQLLPKKSLWFINNHEGPEAGVMPPTGDGWVGGRYHEAHGTTEELAFCAAALKARAASRHRGAA